MKHAPIDASEMKHTMAEWPRVRWELLTEAVCGADKKDLDMAAEWNGME